MLKIVDKLGNLCFSQLMDVYMEANREKGAENYPRLSENRQILEAEQDFYLYLRDCFFQTPGAFYALWVVDGVYASALRLEPYRDGLLLEALQTHPGYRRRGFAKALVGAVLGHVHGQKVYSHVNKDNTPSLATHEACGFHRVLEYAQYIDGTVRSDSCTLCHP